MVSEHQTPGIMPPPPTDHNGQHCPSKHIFLKFPNEVLDSIFDCLPTSDLVSLRLACRFFGPSTTRRLFRSIFLSKAKLDHDKFFKIAESAHLAVAVKELVWHELLEDETTFHWDITKKDGRFIYPPITRLLDGQGCYKYVPPLFTLAKNAFWWPSIKSSTRFKTAYPEEALAKSELCRDKIREDFLTRFFAALDGMPNIIAFVFQAMPSTHIVASGPYPLTAQLFRTGAYDDSDMASDDGFFHFLLPAMRRPESKIQRLEYSDQGVISYHFGAGSNDAPPFPALSQVKLCLGTSVDPSRGLGNILEYLRNATDLEDLRICMNNGNPDADGTYDVLNHKSTTTKLAWNWPKLRRLELSRVWKYDKLRPAVIPGRKYSSMLDFLRRTPTLRHLVFTRCVITGKLLVEMSRIPTLELWSLKIEEDIRDVTDVANIRSVADTELLAFVNGTGPRPEDVSEMSTNFLYTLPPGPSRWNWPGLLLASEESSEAWEPENGVGDGPLSDHACTVYGMRDTDQFPNLEQPFNNVCDTVLRALWANKSCITAVNEDGDEFVKIKLRPGIPGLKDLLGEDLDEEDGDCRGWTHHWLFIHPDGRRAISYEPLDYFSDWEDADDQSEDDNESDSESESES